MPTWLALAWANRVKIYDACKKLRWPAYVWATLASVAAVGAGAYWAVTHGYVLVVHVGSWPPVQWVLVGVNLVIFSLLWLSISSWHRKQDTERDEVDQLRSQVDQLRQALYEHSKPEVPVETIDALPSARPALPERPTTTLRAVRSAPISDREPHTVEREFGGHAFTFREQG